MENDIYNERKQINKIANDKLDNVLKNLEIKKDFYIKNFPNGTVNNIPSCIESTPRTVFSKMNTIDSLRYNKSMNFKNNLNNSNIYENKIKSITRKDNFGNDIKKGGKQKVAFADEIKISTSLMKIKNERIPKNRKSQKFVSSQNKEEDLFPILILKRRSRTPINSRSSMITNFIHIFEYNKNCKKNIEDYLVNVIKFKSTKKENKINTYSIKKNINTDEEEVCCSCYCLIM